MENEVKMSSKEYDFWETAIKTANDLPDKDDAREALRKIQMRLAEKFGYSDDVKALIKKFRYYV